MSEFVLGSLESDYIRTEVRGRLIPDGTESDLNWLDVAIDLHVRPFSGAYRAAWWAGFIGPFREELEALYESLGGEATLNPDWERSLTITLTGDRSGHIAVRGTACPDVGGQGPQLHFQLPGIDQTYLPDLIAALREIEAEFPPAS